MPARATDVFTYLNLTVGTAYTREEALPLAGVSPPANRREITGITRFSNCVVLFVTLNKDDKEANHKYKDEFLLYGKSFQWESQNTNTPTTPHIQMIINREPVVLFARVKSKIKGKTQPFIYVGELTCNQYFFDAKQADKPMEVIFSVDDYVPSPSPELQQLYLWAPGDTSEVPSDDNSPVGSNLIETTPPKRKKAGAKTTAVKTGKASKVVDWAAKDEANRNLGLAGEKLVIAHEQDRLKKLGLNQLVNKVEHVALKDPKAGYDVRSYDDAGNEIYIEVKTTKGSASNAFYISKNEVETSKVLGKKYWIYRVHSRNAKTGNWKVYKLNGPVDQSFDLEPEIYSARVKS